MSRLKLDAKPPQTKVLQNFLKENSGTFRISIGPRPLVRGLFGCIPVSSHRETPSCQTACGGVESRLEKKMRSALRLAGSGVFVCATLISNVSLAQNIANDPIRAQLLTMGKQGLTVTLARDHVIEILQNKNSCSAWFQEVDPKAAATFGSLKFIIDANGPQEVLELRSHSCGDRKTLTVLFAHLGGATFEPVHMLETRSSRK